MNTYSSITLHGTEMDNGQELVFNQSARISYQTDSKDSMMGVIVATFTMTVVIVDVAYLNQQCQ